MVSTLVHSFLPRQTEGKHSETESSVTCTSEDEAKALYNTAVERLMNVNQWHRYAGKATAEFQLFDPEGIPANRKVEKFDLIRIVIPGPKRSTGDGKDWVKVISVESLNNGVSEITCFTVHPTTQPGSDDQKSDHFFSSSASSTFAVERHPEKVIAGVYGRNEKPNSKKNNPAERIRDVVIALGAMLGFSSVQWKAQTRGWLKGE